MMNEPKLSRLALKILRDVETSERLYQRNASSGYTFAGRGVLKLVREGYLVMHGRRYVLSDMGKQALHGSRLPTMEDTTWTH